MKIGRNGEAPTRNAKNMSNMAGEFYLSKKGMTWDSPPATGTTTVSQLLK